jgi:ABC-type branched-subunit amino acid transport system substrate-binding protein
MKRANTWMLLTSLLAVLALLLAACGGEPTATVIPLPTETPAAPVATNTTAPAADTPTTAPVADTPTTAAMADTPTTGAAPGGADVKVGVAFVTSGDSAIYGKSQQPAVEMAFEEINAKGGAGGHKLVGVYEDTAGKPDQAKSVFQKLINSDKVDAIIGPTLSGEAKT